MLEGSILHKLKASHHSGQVGKRSLNFGVYYKNTLVALCHALEDRILSTEEPPLVIAAFQMGKWYLQEADRYARMAEKSRQIVIMAAPDTGLTEHPTSQQENVALVSLDPTDPVAQEWHLMILAPTYTAMVLCQELSAADYAVVGQPTQDLERKFYGFWTFEPGLVVETINLTIEHIGQYNPQLQASLQAQVQEIVTTSPSNSPQDLCHTVSHVVDYLQEADSFESHSYIQWASSSNRLHHNLLSNELQAFLRVAQLIDQADVSNPLAAAEVATLAESLGQLLDLPAWQVHRLRLAGLLHRLAHLQSQDSYLTPSTAPPQEAPSCPLTCNLVSGTQVLRTMPRLRAIATIITHQTEWWNGQGQPAGLAGDDIPLESRILGLLAAFQQRLNHLRITQPDSDPLQLLDVALTSCQAEQGDRWDPKLVDILTLLVDGLRQGLNLPIHIPKIAAGIWLLDSESEPQISHSIT
ncbi:metal-dependent phosphohydrolase [Leptolyngbya sp. 'hensonii']|uniref:DICT sensory domain-containing protein n=1 Tax=Leptolyngbya sp. 'hensonii' TaxID=1922337 RepID=UPI00094FD79B|nr:DICT sensory domain-containing protein [Leptolyngbya sp. 'hensonii']OLP16071.1 metal-dependent phosphohydrolase [Leptolyngbya sp. 'hensonii']